MMNYLKLIKTNNKILIILITAAFIQSCGKEKPGSDYIAKVNDAYLTKKELTTIADSGSAKNLYKSELIRNWIDREILYQQAIKEGIVDETFFKEIIENSKKELAAALLVNKIYENQNKNFEPKEIEEYYQKNKENFKLFYDAYLINQITFNDEDKAVQFRNTVLESNWNKALNAFKVDSSIIREESSKLYYEYEIHPVTLLRIVKELYPQEISIIISDSLDNYIIVQLINKFDKGTIPPFEVIKGTVKSRFTAENKENFIKSYLKDLYSNNEIEVKN